MFFEAYINTAKQIIERYSGREPFNYFLKNFFRENKKFGSRDRKQITHLCYCFFRLGQSLKKYDVEERMGIAVYLCDHAPGPLLGKIDTNWNNTVTLDLNEKIKIIRPEYQFEFSEIFPWQQYLSEVIDFDAFIKSFLIQPDIFIRLRPGQEKIVQEKLTRANIPFQIKNIRTIELAPATKLEEVLAINKEAVIQDVNSQKVIEPLVNRQEGRSINTAWDCCAASGGKSILLKDFFPEVELTVSDVRESILNNLTKRFFEAGITAYKKMVVDVAAKPLHTQKKFDLIICDAPCSGSGTWSRTPEQLYFFDEQKIDHYSSLQKKIVGNAVKNLSKGGFLLYITCSVFKKENEEVVTFIQENLSLKLLDGKYYKGYSEKADTLFLALFVL